MDDHIGASPHRTFADNLFSLCNAHGSIASACRGIGINRQQFNKYLSGSAVPNPKTLSRICGFFHIDPNSMFRHPVNAKPNQRHPQPASEPTPSRLSTAMLAGIDRAIRPLRSGGLREGCHYLYYPWIRDPRMCVRAAVIVHHHEGQAFFSRFTKFKMLGQRNGYYLRGRHDGVALASNSSLHLLATNSRGHGDMSLISFNLTDNARQDSLDGLALVTAAAPAPLALRVLLEYQGPAPQHRAVIRAAGIIPLTDRSLSSYARRSMAIAPDTAITVLKPFQLIDELTAQAPGTAQST